MLENWKKNKQTNKQKNNCNTYSWTLQFETNNFAVLVLYQFYNPFTVVSIMVKMLKAHQKQKFLTSQL